MRAREREMLTWVAEVLQLLLLARKQIPRDCSLCPENIAAAANIYQAATPQGDFDLLYQDNRQQHQ